MTVFTRSTIATTVPWREPLEDLHKLHFGAGAIISEQSKDEKGECEKETLALIATIAHDGAHLFET